MINLSDKNIIRSRWSSGFFGWFNYVIDHRLRGYDRPVDWNSIWMLELSGEGKLICGINGGLIVLLDDELRILILMAERKSDSEISDLLNLKSVDTLKLRNKLSYYLGIENNIDLSLLAAKNNLHQVNPF